MIISKEELADWLSGLGKNPDPDAYAETIRTNPQMVPLMIEIMKTDRGTLKFSCSRIVRLISEADPSLIYPYFDDFARLIDSPNNFIRWGAAITLSNLISADTDRRFAGIYDRYFSLLNSDSMITAATAAGNAWKIILQNPGYEDDITARLLRSAENVYLYKGEPSPECGRIMCGHLLACFDRYYDLSANKEKIIEFARQQRNSSRKSVAGKAEAFLKKHQKV